MLLDRISLLDSSEVKSFCKMYFWCFLVTVFFVCANVIPSPVIQCKLTDSKCIDTLGPALYSKFFEGDPEIGTENLDPMHHNVIDGTLFTLKLKLTNNTVTGFKNCEAKNIRLNLAMLGLNAIMTCPSLKLYGNYIMNGQLETLPFEKTGDYSITTSSYRFSVDVAMKIAEGKNGKNYIAMKNFRLKPEALEPVDIEFKNLFDGQKHLAGDIIAKFSSENWKEITNEIQEPIFNAFFKKIIKNANKFLKSVPIEELIKL